MTEQEAVKSTAAPEAARRISDGGFTAWLQVLGAFCIYFNTWGLLSSYGSFQTYYETTLLESQTHFAVSTIGSLQSFLLVFLGFLAGPVYDAGHARSLLLVGSFLIVAGTIATSFCYELWHLLLAQGLCVGLGCGCLAILSVAIPSLWFREQLPLANGVAATGSGFGGVIFPILVRNLLPSVGFGWTVRALALIILVLLGVANCVMRIPPSAKQRRRLVDRASLSDWPYVLFVLGCFTVFLGMYTPFFYVQSYAIESGIATTDVAFYMVTAMNVASIPGRIVPGLLARRLGPLNMIVGTSVALAGCGLGLLGARSVVSVYAVSVLYGFLTGSFFALQPTVFVQLTQNMAVLGTRFGMAFTIMSVALLFGTPISGALQDAFGYNASWAWLGATILAGAVVISLARMTQGGWKKGETTDKA